ncbi:hypothetical protein CHISP_0285 [Chitinispirillum alkaliphilum]|nr:hypothetical protein CHISP_0285 [Chitinispirillum alkaliphilum]
MNWLETGRFLVLAGTVIVIIGLVFMVSDKLPLGRLPGDIQFGNGRFRLYLPIATSVLLSIVLTVILNFFSRK